VAESQNSQFAALLEFRTKSDAEQRGEWGMNIGVGAITILLSKAYDF
jgi:hypothetical protein